MKKIEPSRQIGQILLVPKNETIFGIVGRMKILLDYFSSDATYVGLVPFLNTYYVITKTVALRMHQGHAFNNPKALEKLDVYFASLYFGPLKKYLETGKAPSPWQAYFEYCRDPKSIPFLQMLLGINAHINGDLGRTVMHQRYTERQDFLKINKILEEKIPEVMSFLAFQRNDTLGLGALMFKNLVQEEFKHVIVKWRDMAFRNAEKIAMQKLPYEGVVSQAEGVAGQLIEIFNHRYDVERAPGNLRAIRALKVRI